MLKPFAFVIHLQRSVDRLFGIEKRIPRNLIEWEFFDAIACPGKNARGCFLSHLGVIREAQRRKLSRVIIFEDDVVVKPDFIIPDDLPAPIIAMGVNCGDFLQWIPGENGFWKVASFFASTAGMIIHESIYESLLSFGEKILLEIDNPEVDVDLYSQFASHGLCNVMVPIPFLIEVMETKSTIASEKDPTNDRDFMRTAEEALALRYLEMITL